MKLRFMLPAAAVAAAVAIPSSASADPTGTCPDHFVPTFVIIQPDAADKDRNTNGVVCHKETPGNGDPTKDDRDPNGFIIQTISDPDPENWADDLAG
jgi:hypothetical protein